MYIVPDCVIGILYIVLIASDLIFKRFIYHTMSYLLKTSFSFFGIGLGFLMHHATLSGQTLAGQSLEKTYSVELVEHPSTEHIAHEMRQCDRWPLSFPCFLLGLITLLISQRDKLDAIYFSNKHTHSSNRGSHSDEEQVYTPIKEDQHNDAVISNN